MTPYPPPAFQPAVGPDHAHPTSMEALMPTAIADLREIVLDLVHNGRTWSGALPPEFDDTSTRRRIEGAAFSFLVMIDGDAGPGPLRLSPKGNPDVDLGGDALHELD